jgi:hypothetical protein
MSPHPFSIVTANRDRLETLRHVMRSWQTCEHVTEVIVIDFGSSTPVRPEHFESTDKLRIIRVSNADCWRIGLAINLGVDQAANEFICKLDSDVAIRDFTFLSRLDLQGSFYRGRDGSGTSNGQVCFSRRAWSDVGGYNEWLSGWGFDDTDFYQRLRLNGVKECALEQGSLAEIPHSVQTRGATDFHTEFLSLKFPDVSTRLTYMTSRNTYLAMLRRWSAELRVPYASETRPDGTATIELEQMSDEFRWSDALASYLAVVRISGTPHNVNILNSLVERYLSENGGF